MASAMMLSVICPENVSPGEYLAITAPNGEEIEVAVPEGIGERNSCLKPSLKRPHALAHTPTLFLSPDSRPCLVTRGD